MKKFSYKNIKKFLITTYLLLTVGITFAQRPDVSPLFDHPIPGELLLDLASNPSHLEKFSTRVKSRRSTYVDCVDALLQLQKMNPDVTIMTPDSFNHYLGQYSSQGYVPIALLDFRYSKLDSSAYTDGIIRVDTLADRLEFTRSPAVYLHTDTATLVYVPYELAQGWNNFILPAELFRTNLVGQRLQVDFGDGSGYRGVLPDMPIPVYYEDEPGDTSEKAILFKFEDRQSFEDVNPVIHGPVRRRVVPGPDKVLGTHELPGACLLGSDPIGDVKVYVRYGQDNKSGSLVDPVVFIEGFDIDANPLDDRYGSMGWLSLMTGFAYDESGRPTRGNIRDITELVQRLYEENYDLVYVDFKNGANDLFANGNSVMRVLKWVELNTVGENGISVLGASMGGIIARYAIRRLEMENCISCVKLYGTFDSPHQGANIPLAIQHAVKFLKDESADALAGYSALMSKAAQQMLVYHIDQNAPTARATWQNWLDENGHPQRPRKIAITNGSPVGSGAGFNPAEQFYLFEHSYGGALMARAALYAVPDCDNSQTCNTLVFDGILPIGSGPLQQYLNRVLRGRYRRYLASSGWTSPLDNASGGQGDWPVYIDLAIRRFLNENRPPGKSKFSSNNKSLTTFIPTFSSLDLNERLIHPNLKDLLPDLYQSEMHPFDAIFYPQLTDNSNQVHVLFDKRPNQNIDWLMANLEQSKSVVPNQIPDQGRYIFNYSGRPYTRLLQRTLVKENGVLHLNGKGQDGFQEEESGTIFPKRRAQFRSHPCGTSLRIENGAKLILGEDENVVDGGMISEFFLEKGEITINDGSLILFDSSVLRIGKDASLILGPGHQLKLNGKSSRLIVEGRLTLKDGSVFSPGAQDGSTPGRIEFREPTQGTITIDGSGNFIVSDTFGSSGDVEWLIRGGVLSIPVDLEFLALKNTQFKLEEQAVIDLGCESRLNNIKALGDKSTGSGFRISESSHSARLTGCSFEDLHTALDVRGASEKVQISRSSFESCASGILFEQSGWKVQTCEFNRNDHGVIGSSGEHPNIFKGNEITANSVGLLILNGTGSGITSVVENLFYGNSKGVELDEDQMLLVGCNTFETNTYGIYTHINSNLYLDDRSPSGYHGGGNTFRFNSNSIRLNGSHIFLDGGLNNFIQQNTNSSYNFISGSIPFTSSTLNQAYELKVGGNYWFPLPSSSSLANTNGYISLQTSGNGNPVVVKPKGNVIGSPNTQCGDYDNGTDDQQGKGTDELQSVFSFYPNPSNGKVQYRLSDTAALNSTFFDSDLYIFDLTGKELERVQVNIIDHNILEWDVPALIPNGHYIFRMGIGNSSRSSIIQIKREQ